MSAMKPGEVVFDQTINGEHVVVRHMSEGDVQLMLDYMNEISKEQTFITFQGEQLTFEDEQKHVNGVLKNMKEGREVKLLLFVNETLSGISEIVAGMRVNSHRGGIGLSLAKDARGKSLGELLLRTVIDEAVKNIQGLRIVQLTCFGNNHVAQKLYKKLGFIENGRMPEAVFYKGEYIDEIMMYKKL